MRVRRRLTRTVIDLTPRVPVHVVHALPVQVVVLPDAVLVAPWASPAALRRAGRLFLRQR